MGYTVEYNPELTKRYPKPKVTGHKIPVILIVSIILVIGIYLLTRDAIIELLVPGDTQVTTAAFSEMMGQIAAGESFKDAFFAFCEDIISNSY
ncbi:MAG: hypothetical protein IKK11_01755 [Oscillospiraceae bacterium]|nr:hypothetical protein [Oscillospiraceae bacterium]